MAFLIEIYTNIFADFIFADKVRSFASLLPTVLPHFPIRLRFFFAKTSICYGKRLSMACALIEKENYPVRFTSLRKLYFHDFVNSRITNHACITIYEFKNEFSSYEYDFFILRKAQAPLRASQK